MNVARLMQQAQRAQAEVQRALGELEVEGSAGGGLVKVRINGLKDLLGITIDRQAIAGEEPALVEDLVMAAWEEAGRQVGVRSAEILSRLGLPPGLGGLI